jgi:hypothetical protein
MDPGFYVIDIDGTLICRDGPSSPTPGPSSPSPAWTAIATRCPPPDLADPDIPYLEALYRGRGRVECAIRDTKDSGLPSYRFAIDAPWLAVVLLASDLLAWTNGLCLDGEWPGPNPCRLRYTLLHAPGILVSWARRQTVRIATGWPRADEIVGAFGRLPSWASIT